MLPEDVFDRIGPLPYMKLEQAGIFYDFILANKLRQCLELGCFHGVSTAYIAGAIEDLGEGQLTTIDLQTALDREPNVEEVLEVVGLRSLVQIYLEPRSFNWRLMRFLQEGQHESYDFCYLDGGHTWYDTGLAFCVVEKLLKPGGWVVFDDLRFTFRDSANRDRSWVRRMPEEEQTEPQVQRVFELLVESNPLFGSFRRMGQFGFAQKKSTIWSEPQRRSNRLELIVSRAVDRARLEPEFRVALLSSPARTLAGLSGMREECFGHLLFLEAGGRAPIAPEMSDYGSTIIYLEDPVWAKTVSEAALLRMLEQGP